MAAVVNVFMIRVIRPDGGILLQVIVPEGSSWEPASETESLGDARGPFIVQRKREPDGEWETLGEATDGWSTYCSRKVRLS